MDPLSAVVVGLVFNTAVIAASANIATKLLHAYPTRDRALPQEL
jgi:hypothetical protein